MKFGKIFYLLTIVICVQKMSSVISDLFYTIFWVRFQISYFFFSPNFEPSREATTSTFQKQKIMWMRMSLISENKNKWIFLYIYFSETEEQPRKNSQVIKLWGYMSTVSFFMRFLEILLQKNVRDLGLILYFSRN